MKRCPHCNTTYTNDSLGYCLQDGTPLIKADSAYAETLINPVILRPQEKTRSKGTLPLILALTGIISALIAYLSKANGRFVYSIIFLATIFVVVLAIFIKARLNADKDQNFLYSLITDNLLPNKSKKSLEVKTEIAIIEDKESKSIYENYRKEFKKVAGIHITHIICDSSDEDSQESSLTIKLKGVEAVIIVRTKELEAKPWVYKALDIWAFQNSHVPCLVIDKINSEELKQLTLSPIPNKYFFIADDKTSLPWRLLQRANDRAFAWRHQASFNRVVALTIILLLLMGFVISYITSSLQRSENENQRQTLRSNYENVLKESYYKGDKDYNSLQKIFNVITESTREEYEYTEAFSKDDTLNASYWFSYGGTIRTLSTTDKQIKHTEWNINEPSIIGCAFAKPNRSVQWDETMSKPLVLPFNEESVSEDNRCGYAPQGSRKITSIVCTSYNTTPSLENTVGICVFTENRNNNVRNKSLDFIKRRTKDFYEFLLPLLEEKKLIPEQKLN